MFWLEHDIKEIARMSPNVNFEGRLALKVLDSILFHLNSVTNNLIL